LAPPCIDLTASNEASGLAPGPAVCFQIGTPTADDADCHFIGTPTKGSIKLKNQDEDECFECGDSDDDSASRASDDDSDCESEADTEASPIRAVSSVATTKKLSWDDVADRNKNIRSLQAPAAEAQEPNWKLEAACHLAGRKGFAAGVDLDDSSDDDSDNELLGCRRDNLDDDFEVGSIGSIDSDIEL
jgi:hypothetical protein